MSNDEIDSSIWELGIWEDSIGGGVPTEVHPIGSGKRGNADYMTALKPTS